MPQVLVKLDFEYRSKFSGATEQMHAKNAELLLSLCALCMLNFAPLREKTIPRKAAEENHAKSAELLILRYARWVKVNFTKIRRAISLIVSAIKSSLV
jgi:hypothetical protein